MSWYVKPPKDDDEYFERMSRAIFQAGLNWKMIENKWPNFRKAFKDFSIEKVSKFNDGDVGSLMNNPGIIRNEKKIRATIFNAKEFLVVKEEKNSFERYIESFKEAHEGLMYDIQDRFRHIGPSSSRTFLWMSGVKLKPTPEEEAWIKAHRNSKDF